MSELAIYGKSRTLLDSTCPNPRIPPHRKPDAHGRFSWRPAVTVPRCEPERDPAKVGCPCAAASGRFSTDSGDTRTMTDDVRLPSDTKARLIIGGLAGLTLVIVRAIQLGFFIGEPVKTALAGWLALLGFAVVSMIGAYITDDHARFKVYLVAVGAPSFFVAFLSGQLQFPSSSADTGSASDSLAIPQLSLLFSAMYASSQSANPQSGVVAQSDLVIEDIDFRSLQSGSIADGLRASIIGQRPPDRRRYLYVIGKTVEEEVAQKTAQELTDALASAYGQETRPAVHLLRGEEDQQILVSIGKFSPTALAAETLRSNVLSVFLESRAPTPAATNLILNGVVVDVTRLEPTP